MAVSVDESFEDFFNCETLSDRVLYIVEVEEVRLFELVNTNEVLIFTIFYPEKERCFKTNFTV